jgi:ribonuclease HII
VSSTVRPGHREVPAMVRMEALLWQLGFGIVAGVDEAGLGPLAGPVVAAAVAFPAGFAGLGVADSKQLSARRREALDIEIRSAALAFSVAEVSAAELDALGARRAGLEAMRRAVSGLDPVPDYLLVDAREVPEVQIPQSGWVKGDSFIHSVAAASILAKVHRDRQMMALDVAYPVYGFGRHMGYGTATHMAALESHGPCPQHRRSFAPVRRVLEQRNSGRNPS